MEQENKPRVEIGMHNHNRPKIEKTEKGIKMLGSISKDSNELEKNFSCNGHIGHEITEIIK
ncbi:hypothetical protein JW977_00235 [Candidatus Falkowbacteria bacterium]|nr:hypothetical protein [Candidatus Falkowbacteria bacterium]